MHALELHVEIRVSPLTMPISPSKALRVYGCGCNQLREEQADQSEVVFPSDY